MLKSFVWFFILGQRNPHLRWGSLWPNARTRGGRNQVHWSWLAEFQDKTYSNSSAEFSLVGVSSLLSPSTQQNNMCSCSVCFMLSQHNLSHPCVIVLLLQKGRETSMTEYIYWFTKYRQKKHSTDFYNPGFLLWLLWRIALLASALQGI